MLLCKTSMLSTGGVLRQDVKLTSAVGDGKSSGPTLHYRVLTRK